MAQAEAAEMERDHRMGDPEAATAEAITAERAHGEREADKLDY